MIDLSLIKPSIEYKRPKMIIYGREGVGKSSFAAQAPNPIVLDLENGMDFINVPKFKASSFVNVLELTNSLISQIHEFQYLIVDSLDWLENLMIAHLCQVHRAQSLTDSKCKAFSYGKGEGLLLAMWKDLIAKFDILHQKKSMGIIFTAHCDIKRFDDPLTESYDMYKIKLAKTSSSLVKEWVECILFANMKVEIEEEEVGFKTVTRGRGAGRTLYTEMRPSFEAKNRYGLPPEIPFSWQAFNNHLDKFYKNITKDVVLVSKDQVQELKDLIDSTGADEEIFLNWLIGSKGAKPIGEVKLENFPASCFHIMKSGLEDRQRKLQEHQERRAEVNHG